MKSASCKLNAVLVAFAVLPLAAHGEVTYSHIKVPVAVVCRDPTMTAYLESSDSPPHFSPQWESIGGHSHCRTVKNDRPLIIVKSVRSRAAAKPIRWSKCFLQGLSSALMASAVPTSCWRHISRTCRAPISCARTSRHFSQLASITRPPRWAQRPNSTAPQTSAT